MKTSCILCAKDLGDLNVRPGEAVICHECAPKINLPRVDSPPLSPAMSDTWVRVMGGA